MVLAADQDIGGVRRDDVFEFSGRHHARHAAGMTGRAGIIAETAVLLVLHAVLMDFLIFRRQRGALALAPGLGRIELDALAFQTGCEDDAPLALPVGIFRFIVRLRDRACHRQRQRQCGGGERGTETHACLLVL